MDESLTARLRCRGCPWIKWVKILRRINRQTLTPPQETTTLLINWVYWRISWARRGFPMILYLKNPSKLKKRYWKVLRKKNNCTKHWLAYKMLKWNWSRFSRRGRSWWYLRWRRLWKGELSSRRQEVLTKNSLKFDWLLSNRLIK